MKALRLNRSEAILADQTGRVNTSRDTAMRFICPRCKAQPGSPCMGSRKPPQPRVSVHIQRIKAVEKYAMKT